MSSSFLFIKALVLGVAIAAPVGPMSILCIRRTLVSGFVSGLSTGMGVATADGIYAALAAFGLTAVIELLVGASPFLRPIGGLLLFYIGVRIFWPKEREDLHLNAERSSHASSYIKTVGLTLANPLTIITFLGIITALEVEAGTSAAVITTLGILIGSALWHLVLVSGFSIAKTFLKPAHFKVINYLSGLALGGLGISMLIP